MSLVLSVCSLAFADQVLLKNGDRLTGTITHSDRKTMLLHTDYAGDLTLKWDSVAGVQSSALHVELQDGRTVVGPVTTTDGKIQIATNSGPVESPISEVKTLRNDADESSYEKSLHPGLLEGWKGGLNLGFALTRGNSETENLSVAFLANRQTLHDKLGAYANSVYATNNTVGVGSSTTANAAGGGGRYDHDIAPRVFGFAAADFFSDALQGLNLRSVLGGGAGYQVIKTDITTLDFLGGLNYTHESYTSLTRNFTALTLGEELMHKWGKSTVLNERLMFYPDLNSLGDYRGTFDFDTVTKMNKWLGWQNSIRDVYVTNPPAGKRQNDVIFTTGLNVSLGH